MKTYSGKYLNFCSLQHLYFWDYKENKIVCFFEMSDSTVFYGTASRLYKSH